MCEIEPRYSSTPLAKLERKGAVSYRRGRRKPRASAGARRAGQVSAVATAVFLSQLESFAAAIESRLAAASSTTPCDEKHT